MRVLVREPEWHELRIETEPFGLLVGNAGEVLETNKCDATPRDHQLSGVGRANADHDHDVDIDIGSQEFGTTLLGVLRQRNFALLWWGGLISLAGDWVLMIGLPLQVYRMTGSTLATGTMFMAGLLPSLLLGSVAGVFVAMIRADLEAAGQTLPATGGSLAETAGPARAAVGAEDNVRYLYRTKSSR